MEYLNRKWYESFDKFWCFLQDSGPCFEKIVQWKLSKSLFCTALAESKDKKMRKPIKETLKYCKQVECFTGLAPISGPSTLANLVS